MVRLLAVNVIHEAIKQSNHQAILSSYLLIIKVKIFERFVL